MSEDKNKTLKQGQNLSIEGRFYDFMSLSSDVFWESDDALVLAYVSPQIRFFTQSNVESLVGQKLGAGLELALDDETWDEVGTEIINHKDRPVFSQTLTMYDCDSQIAHINLTTHPVLSDNGQEVIGYRGVFRDITIEVSNSLNAELIERRLSDTIECIPYGIALFDPDDKLIFANSKHNELFPEMSDFMQTGVLFEDVVRAIAQRGIQPLQNYSLDQFVQKRMALHKNGFGTREVQLSKDRWIEMSEYVTAEGATVISWTDLTPMKRREKALSSLLGDTSNNWSVSERAVKAVAIAMGARWAGVVKYDPDDDFQEGKAKMVAMWDDDHLLPPFFYDLKKSPCCNVYEAENSFFRQDRDVAVQYPDNPLTPLARMQSYRAMAIHSSKGQIIGHIFVADEETTYKGAHREGREIFRLIAHWVEIEFRRQYIQRRMIDSQTRFRDFAEVASDWFWEVDSQLNFTFLSSHAVEASQEILKEKLQEAHDKAKESGDPMSASAMTIGTSAGKEIIAFHPFRDIPITMNISDHNRIIKVSGRPIFDINGGFKGYRGTGADISDFVEALQRATQAEQWLVEAIESAPEAFALYDNHDRLVICNQKFKDAFFDGIQNQIKQGMTFREIQKIHFDAGLSDIPKGQQEKWIENRLIHRGNPEASKYNETLANGRSYLAVEHITKDGGIASFYVDITELRENERILREAKDLAEAASRGKSEFLANISHELRTPLNAIIGFSELMYSGIAGAPNTDKYNEYLHDIHQSGVHLLELINDILDLSKAEAGMLEQYDEETDVADVMENCMKLVMPRAKNGQISLSVTGHDDLPLLVVDPKRLKQILLNLLSNAVKFTPEGGSVVLEGIHDDDGLQLIVKDTGIGMSEQDIPKAMEAFSQVDSSLSRKYEGTGLGLPLTKRLVEGSEGELIIRSQPEKGTTVIVKFPTSRLVRK